ncbi:hypothetical protein HZA97_01360 [Candidatus Woesearchaeota archaeon]|nr:hypothetical protein [Candidatus Woesearchaeota archaeon]
MEQENKVEKPYYRVVHAYGLTPKELGRANNLDEFVSKISTVGYDENGETFVCYFPWYDKNELRPFLLLYKDTSSEPITGLEEAAQKISEKVNGHVETHPYGFKVVLRQKISQKEFPEYLEIFKTIFGKLTGGDGRPTVFYDNMPVKELQKSGLPRKKLKNLHTLVK